MIELQKVQFNQLEELSALASKVWHEAYDVLLGLSQVDYMVESFQSKQAFENQLESGYEYYFIIGDGMRCGYVGIVQEKDKMFLSKLYLKAEHYGRGIAQTVLNMLKEESKARGLKSIYLTVNKGNGRAIKAYERFGFIQTDSIVTDIGRGFVMDDYVYTFAI
ncbi:MAG: GNAT family N-acetyltransferase [Clostridia bacterium]|nr:GNAT family N-acetyltransferase [Clostridia bacterium]